MSSVIMLSVVASKFRQKNQATFTRPTKMSDFKIKCDLQIEFYCEGAPINHNIQMLLNL
jgi:hypothetical protein